MSTVAPPLTRRAVDDEARNMRITPVLALVLLGSAASGWPQPDSLAHSYTADVTMITATRDRDRAIEIPQASTVVTARDIHRGERGVSLDEALRHVPGLTASNRNNLSQGERLMLRGLGSRASFGVRGVKVILDGVPLTTPDGQTQLGNIDLAAAERIEVLRGPSSSLYGNAGGGVVVVHSRQPAEAGWSATPGLTLGSDGLRRTQLHVNGASERHRLSLNLRHLRSDGFRDHSEALIRGLSALSQHTLSESWQLSTVLNVYDAPWLLNPSSLAQADAESQPRHARGFIVSQGASKVARQIQGGVTLQHETSASRSEVTLFAIDRSLYNPIPGGIIDLDRLVGGVRASHRVDVLLGGLDTRWQLGADAEFQRDERQEFDNEGLPDGATASDLEPEDVPDAVVRGAQTLAQTERVHSLSPFLVVDLRPAPRWLFTVGARLDRTRFEVDDDRLDDGDQSGSRWLSQISPSLGASWRLGQLTWIYANLGSAFQTPTTTELSNRADGAGGFNPDLEPVTILNAELGARGGWSEGTWDLALYRMTVDDMLIPFQVEDPASEAVYFRNAGRARSLGVEAMTQAQIGERVDVQLSGTWLDFTFDDYVVVGDDGERDLADSEVPGVPPGRVALTVSVELPRRSWLELEGERVAGYWADDDNGPARTSFNDGYGVLALRLGGALPVAAGIRWFVGIDNLLDQRYNGSVTPNAFGGRFFEPAAGRTWHAGVRLPTGP